MSSAMALFCPSTMQKKRIGNNYQSTQVNNTVTSYSIRACRVGLIINQLGELIITSYLHALVDKKLLMFLPSLLKEL